MVMIQVARTPVSRAFPSRNEMLVQAVGYTVTLSPRPISCQLVIRHGALPSIAYQSLHSLLSLGLQALDIHRSKL